MPDVKMSLEMVMPMAERRIRQAEMTAECWVIQLEGPEMCEKCVSLKTDDCTGETIRKTGKNDKGYVVPLGKDGES